MKLGRLLVALPLVAGLSIAGATMASAQGVQAFAALFGGNETPPNASPGYGAVALTFHGTGTVCFGIVVDRIGVPNAAHIHPGRAGDANPPAVVLIAPNTGNPGSSSGCVTLTDTTLFGKIRNSPSDFYVNVHTAAFPNGEIRGQLF
jgi:hypothetical protein